MQPLKRQMLRDEVYEAILERLLGGAWEPGARLSIEGLAREFDASPSPVREALASLETTGLVVRTALKGYQVAPQLTAEQIHQLMDAREVLETAALTRAFASWDAFVEDLRAAHREHERAIADFRGEPAPTYRDFRRHIDADWAFHRVFLRHAHNQYLATAVSSLGSHVHRLRQMFEDTGLDAGHALDEHAIILRRVEERNHDGALAALRTHLEAVHQRSSADLPADPTGTAATPS